MSETSWKRLFDARQAFAEPVVLWTSLGLLILLGFAYVLTLVLAHRKVIGPERKQELWQRLHSWAILIPVMLIPLLLGAAWAVLALMVLSLFCYREFARLTGLFRNYRVSAWIVAGIFLLFFAALDHWYRLMMALQTLGVGLIAAAGVYVDRPQGYLQRVALGTVAFLFFGVSFAHVAYVANDQDYRALLLLFFVAVEMNDIFAYLFGNLFGRKRLCPNTSPGKTMAGSIGAIFGTSLLVLGMGQFVFDGEISSAMHLILLGVILSVTGQLGDLVMSSIKRDLGIKDTGRLLPGHGGLLDRFDSLLLAGPAYFHYVNYFRGIGLDEPHRIFACLGG